MCADVACIVFTDFIQCLDELRNYHAIAAIGQGLYTAGVRPSKPSRIRSLLNPEDNFAACRKRMIERPGLPFLFPQVHELKASGIESAQLIKLFTFVGYFGKGEEESPKGESRTLYKVICMLYTYWTSCGAN